MRKLEHRLLTVGTLTLAGLNFLLFGAYTDNLPVRLGGWLITGVGLMMFGQYLYKAIKARVLVARNAREVQR